MGMTNPLSSENEDVQQVAAALADAQLAGGLSDGYASVADDALCRIDERLRELLVARDHWRNRCDVEPSDVEAAGITWEKFDAWCEAHGFKAARRPERWHEPKLKTKGRSDIGWVRGDTFYGEPWAWPGGDRPDKRRAGEVARFVNWVGKLLDRPAFAILDEMAATEVGP